MQNVFAVRRGVLAGALAFGVAVSAQIVGAQSAGNPATPMHRGYYTYPAVRGENIVFTSEGDLWVVGVQGGVARRLTSNPGTEWSAVLSADGKTVAFSAEFEGPTEVYTMPVEGGIPQRRTWDGDSRPAGFAPDGRLMVATSRYATLPETQLVLVNDVGAREIVPLAQAAQGAYSPEEHNLFFTRWYKQPSETKRYKGGTAESIWKFDGKGEAVPLTGDYEGASTQPMVWEKRVYFLSDRDGVMNVYSMDEDGKGVKQESHQKEFDITSASLDGGRIVYASGADLWLLDLKSGKEQVVPVTLTSDFEQLREHWVKKPSDYLTAVHIAPDGNSAVFTARGEVFTLPLRNGRTVKVAANSAVRYREARFLPDGKNILAVSTESGETEFWKFPANGEGKAEQWTNDAKVLRWDGLVSPDGNWLAHHDKDEKLWLFDVKAKKEKLIAESMTGDFADLQWSPDSKWLAFVQAANNQFAQIKVLNVGSGEIKEITSDRYDSINPVWSADGKWMYFLSDRALKTVVESPWGPRQPEPFFDHQVKVYQLALVPDLRSPFLPPDELHPDGDAAKDEKKDDDKSKDVKKDDKKSPDMAKKAGEKKPDEKKDDKKEEKKPPEVKIDFAELSSRLTEVPVPAGNYGNLQATEKRLCWLSDGDNTHQHLALQCVDVANKGDEVDNVMGDVKQFEISQNRKKLLVRKGDEFFILDSDVKPSALGDAKALAKQSINLSRWTFSTKPVDEYRGIFLDAWRLERDYFYDKNMHGVDWAAMRDRYLPLVDRVANRDELNGVIAQMVGELSALHIFVVGGDQRKPADQIDLASLGARLRRDEKAGGFVVEHVYLHDPDMPDMAPPLARPESLVREGEVIVAMDGQDLLGVTDERALLRGKAGTQVLLKVKNAAGTTRELLVTPMSGRDEARLRYAEWEYSRRTQVEKESNNTVGYVHLRAMGSGDIDQWAREFYPVFDRQGLIIDVRHNNGGNIDSWLLSKLMRKAWFYFQPRVGSPSWNMQYAFRGHIVVLCDQSTASDGEAFTEGFKRLGLGKVIGMRTWGGEVWLSFSNTQADNGIASAAEIGVYGPEGKWLIEGHGAEPDIAVDDLPHGTYAGNDEQLNAALKLLQEEIKADPRPVPQHPAYPNKSFKGSGQ
ncbi:S41 family peptidase [Occallatibacter savannae]|uniref:S41 family peptidase n=1 Tax=Occallatibacter savannae TaxID=1002691 RepID=UPI0013A5A126|nr:S41 family peptidase [Occallatibacter savannae]